jgi:hypothetical protein
MPEISHAPLVFVGYGAAAAITSGTGTELVEGG